MGTRNLTAVFIDGEYKIAQYGQWDGYPEGQGATALDFLRMIDIEKFKAKCRALTWVDEKKLEQLWKDYGARDDGSIECSKADLFGRNYPQFSRDTGAKILRVVAFADDGMELQNSLEFVSNSLFCEWAYVIDFDKGTFEVYQGFNQEPLNDDERFAGMPLGEKCHNGEQYHPVKLVKAYPLTDLPSNETLNLECNPPEEDEDEDEDDE